MLRDTRGAGSFGGFLLVRGDLSRRSWAFGIGGGGFFCQVTPKHEFELGGIELFARLAKDPAAERVDGLFEDGDLGGLTRDDLIALCDLVKQALSFVVVHLRAM